MQDYEKVANAFAAEPNVIVAKIDADTHKTAGGKYGVTGFPTIKWFGKDNKDEPLAYSASRDVASFIDFINEKSGTKRLTNGRLNDDVRTSYLS